MKSKLNNLLATALELKASDVHLTIGVPPILRIHGVLKRLSADPLVPLDTEEISRSMMTEMMWNQFKDKGELDYSYETDEGIRFRVNAFHQRSVISLALRPIPRKIPSLEELYLPEVLKNIAGRPQGLVLVTGPTGSGKSTTLAAMIDHINQSMRKHIITLEDPIEFLHVHKNSIIDQREVGQDTQSFANGLRAALRQDPDVILVGEMRDMETISTAITAAETGHLVFSTLHTTDAPSTVDRIIDVFPASQQTQIRFQLASVLLAVVSQRLFPTSDRKGRRAATEIMIGNTAIANLIRNEKVHQINTVLQTSRAMGMQTLDMSIKELIQNRLISQEGAESYLLERGI